MAGETLVVKNKKTGETYTVLTGSNGTALCVVPKNADYELSLKHFANVTTIHVENTSRQALATYEYTILYPSSQEIEKQKLEREIRIAERDSLYKLFDLKKELPIEQFNKYIQFNLDSIKQGLKEDPHHFQATRNAVCAVLYRFRDKWMEKVLVTDVTGSMYPYREATIAFDVKREMSVPKASRQTANLTKQQL